MASKKKKKKAKRDVDPVVADAPTPSDDPVADGAPADGEGQEGVAEALSIPSSLADHPSIPDLETAHQLFLVGNYGAARDQVGKVQAQKDLPEPISQGTEIFLSAMGIDGPSLMVTGLLAVFLIIILFLVY